MYTILLQNKARVFKQLVLQDIVQIYSMQRVTEKSYEELMTKLLDRMIQFYETLASDQSALQKLGKYGGRAEIYKTQLRKDLEHSAEETARQIMKQLPKEKTSLSSVNQLIQSTRAVLNRRMDALSNQLAASTLQMNHYMLLWDYQNLGHTHYCVLSEGNSCEDCQALTGQRLPISQACAGQNFPPMHPNCRCRIGILDEENRIVSLIGKGQTQELDPNDKTNKKWLDGLSDALNAASLIPGLDTFTNLASIPVDLARGDSVSAGLSALGVVPVVGEVADAAKLAKMADKAVDAAKVAKTAKSGKSIIKATKKSSALKSVDTLPSNIQKSAKSFFKGSSNNYNSYSVIKNKNNTYTIKMENPGKVPGSKAVYNKIVDSNGKTIKVYKDTFDPLGNLVHRKDK